MTKKVESKVTVSSDGWKGYVNWSPLATDREKAGALIDSLDWSYREALETLVESGYTASFSHEDRTGAFRLALTGKARPCPNIGYTLSIRASSIERVLALAHVYVYDICLGGDWLFEREGKEVW